MSRLGVLAGPALLQADLGLERRRRRDKVAGGMLLAAALVSVGILAILLIRIGWAGWAALTPSFFANVYSPLGILDGSGGILDALIASVVTLFFAMLFAVPVGVGGAIWLSEYAPEGRFKRFVEGWIANLAAVPSVVYGLLGLAVFLRFMDLGASLLSAGLTLAVLILPILIVSSKEALKSVPMSVREASDALGASRWQTIRSHVLPYALPGMLTGNILALSRAAGETAPLLLLGLPVYQTLLEYHPQAPGTPLQLRIFFLAERSEATALQMAWGAVIVLVAATLVLNLAAILIRHRISKRTRW